MRTLTVNRAQLLDLIDPNDAFITELGTAGCITWPQREHIVDTVHRRDRNDLLIKFITRRSVADFNNFINILSKEQPHLVPMLLTGGGETYFNHFQCAFYCASAFASMHSMILFYHFCLSVRLLRYNVQ